MIPSPHDILRLAHDRLSHAAEATNVRWREEAGPRVAWTRFAPEGDGGHALVWAEKSTGAGRGRSDA